MKTAEKCCSITRVNFGRCYGNQGWAEPIENQICVLKISSFEVSKSFKSYAEMQGLLEIIQVVYLGAGGGGGHKAPPLFGMGLTLVRKLFA